MPRKAKQTLAKDGTPADLRHLTEQVEAARQLANKNVEEVVRLNLVVGRQAETISTLNAELEHRKKQPFRIRMTLFGITIGSLEIHGIEMAQVKDYAEHVDE